MKKKIRFIVNRFSGVSNKENIEDEIARHLDHDQFDYEVKFTEGPNHAIQLAKEAVSSNIDIVASVGGDGTVNEIASQLINSSTSLAVLPGGSGNGFAMHLGMGRDIIAAIRILNHSDVLKIDTCDVNGHFFINVCGIGFDGIIAQKIKNSPHRGIKLYIKQLFLALKYFKATPFKIQVDGQSYDNQYVNVVIANASMYGYSATIAPEANLTDGLFDLVLIKKVSFLRYLISSFRLFNKSFHKASFVETIKAKEISIQNSESDLHYHLDGEGKSGESNYSFKLNPKSLNVIIPKGKII